jgi:predicted amidohydrolase
MSAALRVACAQTGSVDEDTPPTETLERARGWIARAAEAGAELVVFPELFHAPFFPRTLRRDVAGLFWSADGREVTDLRAACRRHRIAAVLPIAERAGAAFYNSAVLVDGAGALVGIYRKSHIPAYMPTDRPGGTGSYEKFYFTPGEGLPVFDFGEWRCGIQICNDRLYPEASRVLALKGAQMIVMPISYSTYDADAQRRANWDAVLRARAIENALFVIACNRVGTEGPRHHLGVSMIVAPDGEVLATGSDDTEELILADLKPEALEAARFGMPWWRDRRPNLYSELAAPEVPAFSQHRGSERV